MPDFYFEDYDREEREEKSGVCCQSIGILCVIIIGFIVFFMFYAYIWEMMLPSFLDYGTGFASLGLIIMVIILVYIIRNRSLEKRKIMAAS